MISNKIVFTTIEYKDKSYKSKLLYLDNKLTEISLDREDNPSVVGNRYIGKVSKISKELNAAFVKVSDDTEVYLPLCQDNSYIYTNKLADNDRLSQGDEILVEIIKDPIKTKLAVASNQVSFASESLVIVSQGNNSLNKPIKIGVSKKIKPDIREALKEELQAYIDGLDLSYSFELIVRTNAESFTNKELLDQVSNLISEYNTYMNQIVHKSCFYCQEATRDYELEYINACRDYNIQEIVTDDLDLYNKLNKSLTSKAYNQYTDKLRLYRDNSYPLSLLYNFESELKSALSREVHLKSGASIIIEQTETLTFIDVNTAKSSSKKSKEDYVFSINCQAADEIAKQLRLRNISGMIIVDFINMNSKQEDELFSYMKSACKGDSSYVKVIDFTKLGLLEMTREKKYKSLKELL